MDQQNQNVRSTQTATGLGQQEPALRTGYMSTGLEMGQQTFVVGYDSARLTSSKAREISIHPLDRGYMVKVGCTTVAITTIAELIEKLTEYLKDPAVTEEKFNKGEFFKP